MNPQTHRRPKRAARKVQLRELSVRKAKPKDKAYVIWDTKQRGLALRIQPTGSKAWVFVYSRQGRPRWLTLGAADAVGLADARILAAEAMLAVAKGKDPAAEKKAERGAGTFADLADRYVTPYAQKQTSRGGRPTPWCAACGAAVGQVAGCIDQPGRRQGHDGAHRGADRRQSDLGRDLGDLHLGREGRDRHYQSVQVGRSQPDQGPRPHFVGVGGAAVLESDGWRRGRRAQDHPVARPASRRSGQHAARTHP